MIVRLFAVLLPLVAAWSGALDMAGNDRTSEGSLRSRCPATPFATPSLPALSKRRQAAALPKRA
jgi:hypothetical protein